MPFPSEKGDADPSWQLAVKQSILLRGLSEAERLYILRSLYSRTMDPLEELFAEGSEANSMYIVQSGRLRASRTAHDGSTQELVREYQAGDTFGSCELIHEVPRMVTISAATRGTIWVLPKKIFDLKLRKAPAPPPSLGEAITLLKFDSQLPSL